MTRLTEQDLRRRLDRIAAALSDDEPDPAPERETTGSRRGWLPGRAPTRIAVAAVVAVAVAAVAVTAALRADREPDAGPEAAQALTDAETVACSDGIALGRVVSTAPEVSGAPEADEQIRLRLDVTEWLKRPPGNAPARLDIAVMSPQFSGTARFGTDEAVLVILQSAVSAHQVFRADPTGSTDPASLEGMTATVRRILRAGDLPRCPDFWGTDDVSICGDS